MANLLWEQILSPNSPLQPSTQPLSGNTSWPSGLHPTSSPQPLSAPPSSPLALSPEPAVQESCLSFSVSHHWGAVFLYPRVHQHALLTHALSARSFWVHFSLPSVRRMSPQTGSFLGRHMCVDICMVLSEYQLESRWLLQTNGLTFFFLNKAFSRSIINFFVRLPKWARVLILTSSYNFLIHSLTVLNDNFCFFFWLMK